jgi:hypothetical protein
MQQELGLKLMQGGNGLPLADVLSSNSASPPHTLTPLLPVARDMAMPAQSAISVTKLAQTRLFVTNSHQNERKKEGPAQIAATGKRGAESTSHDNL